MVRKV